MSLHRLRNRTARRDPSCRLWLNEREASSDLRAATALFTQPCRRGILRRWLGCRIAPLAGHQRLGLRLLGSSKSTTIYVARAHKDALRWMRAILSEHRRRYGGRGSQVLTGRPNIRGSAGPDMDMGTSRFGGCYLW